MLKNGYPLLHWDGDDVQSEREIFFDVFGQRLHIRKDSQDSYGRALLAPRAPLHMRHVEQDRASVFHFLHDLYSRACKRTLSLNVSNLDGQAIGDLL